VKKAFFEEGTVESTVRRAFFDNGVLRALCGLRYESKNASGKGIEGTILASPTPPHNEYFFPKICSFSVLSLSMPSEPITSQRSVQRCGPGIKWGRPMSK
jgi:hypothetical protein